MIASKIGIHTIEAVLKFTTRSQFSPLRRVRREESIKGQTQEIVAKSTEGSLRAEETRKASPSHFLLQLLQIEATRVKQRRSRAS